MTYMMKIKISPVGISILFIAVGIMVLLSNAMSGQDGNMHFGVMRLLQVTGGAFVVAGFILLLAAAVKGFRNRSG